MRKPQTNFLTKDCLLLLLGCWARRGTLRSLHPICSLPFPCLSFPFLSYLSHHFIPFLPAFLSFLSLSFPSCNPFSFPLSSFPYSFHSFFRLCSSSFLAALLASSLPFMVASLLRSYFPSFLPFLSSPSFPPFLTVWVCMSFIPTAASKPPSPLLPSGPYRHHHHCHNNKTTATSIELPLLTQNRRV